MFFVDMICDSHDRHWEVFIEIKPIEHEGGQIIKKTTRVLFILKSACQEIDMSYSSDIVSFISKKIIDIKSPLVIIDISSIDKTNLKDKKMLFWEFLSFIRIRASLERKKIFLVSGNEEKRNWINKQLCKPDFPRGIHNNRNFNTDLSVYCISHPQENFDDLVSLEREVKNWRTKMLSVEERFQREELPKIEDLPEEDLDKRDLHQLAKKLVAERKIAS